MSFPRYPRYKDSGVEWLGQVPEHWTAKKIGAISSLKGRLGWQGLKADEYRDEGPYVVSSAHFDNHRIQWDECPRVSQERYDTDYHIQLAVDDLLLMKDGAAMGKLAFVDCLPGPACLNSHLLLFRPIKIDGRVAYCPRFAFYFMQTGYFQEHIKVNGTGATFLGVSQDTIGRYQVVLPALVEQTAIAAFLDRETGRIDGLVAEQRRLMELLKEKRQAVISHAVTCGLNPAAPLKPSGIEWLGDVPQHWRVMALKRLIASGTSISYGIVQPGEPLDDGVPFVQTTNMTKGSFNLESLQRTTAEIAALFPRSKLTGGEVILGIRASIGAVHVVPETLAGCNLSRGVARIVPNQEITSRYLVAFFGTDAVSRYWQLSKQGSTFNEVSIETVRELSVCVPPIKEQAEIAEFVATESNRFDTLTAEAQRAIDLLQERRTALISAAVTGQIDVRALRPA